METNNFLGLKQGYCGEGLSLGSFMVFPCKGGGIVDKVIPDNHTRGGI